MIKEFKFINLFRAVAAFWVVSAHCMIWGGWYKIPLPSAKIAVDLFMVISGFLMAANVTDRNHFEPLTKIKNWFRFWLRRFFRIAPAYYISLSIAILSSSYFLGGYQELQNLNPARWPSGGVYDPSRVEYTLTNLFLHISFIFGLHPTYSFSTFLPDWSLSLEMQFYFVFPSLFLAMKKYGFLRSAIFFGIPVFVLGFGVSKLIHYNEPSLLIFKLNYFLAGIILFRFLTLDNNNRMRLYLALSSLLLVSIDFRYRIQLIVLPTILLIMLFLGWLETTKRLPKWMWLFFNSRIVCFASDTSYGVYLFHGFFISASGLIISKHENLLKLLPQQRVLFIFLFVTISAYVLSYLVYLLIELPMIRLGKRLIEKITPLGNNLLPSNIDDIQHNNPLKPTPTCTDFFQ